MNLNHPAFQTEVESDKQFPTHFPSMYAMNKYFQCRKNALENIILNDALTAFYQPIVSLEGRSIFAYEALCRTTAPNPFKNIEALFDFAHKSNLALQLDMYCRENGLSLASAQNIQDSKSQLFINNCPSSLIHPDHSIGGDDFIVVTSPKRSIPRAS